MSATRFNPDPVWSVWESEDGRRFTIDCDGGPMLPRKTIATVYNSRRVDGKANARLIAAAPDLLGFAGLVADLEAKCRSEGGRCPTYAEWAVLATSIPAIATGAGGGA